MEYVVDKYRRNWKEDGEIFDIILEDFWQKACNEPEVAKVIVISFSDEDLSTDKKLVLIGDIPFSTINDDDIDEEQSQAASTSRRYRKSRVVNALDVDVGYSSMRRKSRSNVKKVRPWNKAHGL
ncbi:hypothetical protein Tco_0762963 [Tanacetum coccineum]